MNLYMYTVLCMVRNKYKHTHTQYFDTLFAGMHCPCTVVFVCTHLFKSESCALVLSYFCMFCCCYIKSLLLVLILSYTVKTFRFILFCSFIRSTSKSRPNNIRGGKNVRPYVRTSVRPSVHKKFRFQ